jgi:hypothetical protein
MLLTADTCWRLLWPFLTSGFLVPESLMLAADTCWRLLWPFLSSGFLALLGHWLQCKKLVQVQKNMPRGQCVKPLAEHKPQQQHVQHPQQQPLAAQRTTGQEGPEFKLSESGQNMQRLNAKASAASRRLRPLSRVPKKWSSKGGRCLMWRPMNMRLACL